MVGIVRRIIRYTGIAAVLMMLLAVLARPASADPASGSGSIEVTADRNVASGTVPVPGTCFDLWMVSGVDVSTQQGRDLADRLIHHPDEATGSVDNVRHLTPTDQQGMTSASDLPLGLYLLKQTCGPVAYADMVFAVPSRDTRNGGDVLAYNLSVYPKPADTQPTPTPTQTVPQPSVTPTHSTPAGAQTGSPVYWRSALWFLGVAAVVVAVICLVGWRVVHQDDRR